jgi:TonB family protein
VGPETAALAENAPPVAEPAPAAAAEVRPAVKTFSVRPDYPETARLAGLSGTVIVEAEIDPEGAVASTRVLRSVSPELDQAAREAVGRWRFEPATANGEPVAEVYRAAIHFELEPPVQPAAEQKAEVASLLPAAEDFEPPVRLYAPPPSYPPADWVAAVEGDVVVQAAISETGQVTGVEVLQGLTAGVNEAAIEALKRWRFRPATRQGQAVASDQVLTFRFAR